MQEDACAYMTVPDEGFFFVPLGGVGEIGMNFALYACDGEWLAVDCGIGFAGEGLPGIDKLLPDISFARTIADKLKALIITHAHEDHIGAVAQFWRDLRCPVYATPFAAEMLEDKLDETSLLGRVPVEIYHKNDVLEFDNFSVSVFALNHSIPESASLLIKTKYGNVFHTGDWRFDASPVIGKAADEKDLKGVKSKNLLALVGDSTNVFVDKEDAGETDVGDSLVRLFSRYADKRIVVTCFASNVSRIESVARAAKANGRDVCLVGRSLWRVEGAGRAAGYFKDIDVFLTPEEARERPLNSVVYVLTGCQGEPKAALSNLSYGVLNSLRLDAGDVVIFSSRAIPGNEQAIANIQNRFIAKDVQVVTSQTALVHVSGHATRHDMERMYQTVKPSLVIPVHGEIAHLREHVALAKSSGAKAVCKRHAPNPATTVKTTTGGATAAKTRRLRGVSFIKSNPTVVAAKTVTTLNP